jgi:hypothetical protein
MANTIETLIGNGAPELVEPRFYRVKFDDVDGNDLVVEVRERLRYFGSKCLASVKVDRTHARHDSVGAVVRAAQIAVERLAGAEELSALVGDHKAARRG